MKNQPVVVKIALAYLPAVVLLFIFCRLSWWAGALAALAGLAACVLLWVFIFEAPAATAAATKNGFDPALLNKELKNTLVDTQAAGTALLLAVNSLQRRTENFESSLSSFAENLASLPEPENYYKTAFEALQSNLPALAGCAHTLSEAQQNYLEYAGTVEGLAAAGRQVLEQAKELGAENETAVEGASQALQELEGFQQKTAAAFEAIISFTRRASALALNVSVKTTQRESLNNGPVVATSEITELANFAGRSLEKIKARAEEVEGLSKALGEKLELSAAALSLQDMQLNALKEAMEKLVSPAGEAATRFANLNEKWVALSCELAEAGAKAEVSPEPEVGKSTVIDVAKEGVKEQEDKLQGLFKSVSWSKEKVEELQEKAGRFGLPLLGYLDEPAGKAGAYLFKHWYKRDTGLEVVLTAIDSSAADELYAAMAEGLFDATISLRSPGPGEGQVESYGDKLELLGTNLAGLRRGFLVPEYVTIGTIGVLRRHSDKFGGAIYIVQGHPELSAGARLAQEEYKTEMELVFESTENIAKELKEAVQEKRWLVVAGAEPEPVFEAFGLKLLTDPKRCFGAEEFLKTVTKKSLKEEQPEYYRALQRFRWGVAEVSLFMQQLNLGLSYDEAAQKVLQNIKFTLL